MSEVKTDKAIAYLRARSKILESSAGANAQRALDGRCSPHSRSDWSTMSQFDLTELSMVREALYDLTGGKV